MIDDFKVFQNRADMNVIFVHSELDDRNLSSAEFRVYCHLARRSGGGKAWPGIDSISRVCNLAKGTVIAAIRSLEAQKMVTAERTPGVPTRYILTPCSQWQPLPSLDRLISDTVSKEVTERVNPSNATVSKEVTKGNPLKVIQEGDTGRSLAKRVNGHRFQIPSIEANAQIYGKNNGSTRSNGSGNSANRNTGTLNEGKASQYRGVGKVV